MFHDASAALMITFQKVDMLLNTVEYLNDKIGDLYKVSDGPHTLDMLNRKDALAYGIWTYCF